MSRLTTQEARALERICDIDRKSMQVIDAVNNCAIIFCRSSQKFAALPIGVKRLRFREATWFKRVDDAYSLAKREASNTGPLLVIYEEYKRGANRWDVAEVCLQAGRMVVTTSGEPFERWSYNEHFYAFSGTRNDARKLVRKMNAAHRQFEAVKTDFRKRVSRQISTASDLILALNNIKPAEK